MHLCEIIYQEETGSQRNHDLFLSFAGNVPDKTKRQPAEMQNESGFSDPGGIACLYKSRVNMDYRPQRGHISIEIKSKPGLPTPEGSYVYRNQREHGLPTPAGSHVYRNKE